MAKNKTKVKPDWYPKPATVEWIRTHRPHIDVDDFVEMFKDQCEAVGYKYVNHDSALKNWARRNEPPKTDPRLPAQKIFKPEPVQPSSPDKVHEQVFAMRKAIRGG